MHIKFLLTFITNTIYVYVNIYNHIYHNKFDKEYMTFLFIYGQPYVDFVIAY